MHILTSAVSAALLWTATAAAGQAQPPADEASIDRFMAVLPDAETLDDERGPDPGEMERLRALNPGREAQVETIMIANAHCRSAIVNRKTEELLRGIARGLGQEKLERMIAFYEGPESARADHLFDRIENGEELSPAEQAEADSILARYPIEEMMDGLDNLHLAIGKDQAFLDGLTACDRERTEAFTQADLRP